MVDFAYQLTQIDIWKICKVYVLEKKSVHTRDNHREVFFAKSN